MSSFFSQDSLIIISSGLAGSFFMIIVIYLYRCCMTRRDIAYQRVGTFNHQTEEDRLRFTTDDGLAEDEENVNAMFGYSDDWDDSELKHIEMLERYEEGLRKAASGESWTPPTEESAEAPSSIEVGTPSQQQFAMSQDSLPAASSTISSNGLKAATGGGSGSAAVIIPSSSSPSSSAAAVGPIAPPSTSPPAAASRSTASSPMTNPPESSSTRRKGDMINQADEDLSSKTAATNNQYEPAAAGNNNAQEWADFDHHHQANNKVGRGEDAHKLQ